MLNTYCITPKEACIFVLCCVQRVCFVNSYVKYCKCSKSIPKRFQKVTKVWDGIMRASICRWKLTRTVANTKIATDPSITLTQATIAKQQSSQQEHIVIRPVISCNPPLWGYILKPESLIRVLEFPNDTKIAAKMQKLLFFFFLCPKGISKSIYRECWIFKEED